MEALSSFGINVPLLIASIINFLILLLILNKVLYKPLLDVLESRRRTIQESLDNAEKIEKTLAETEEKERSVMHAARLEAQTLIKKAEEQAHVRQKELLAQAEEQAQKIVLQSEKRMEEQARKLQADIQEGLASLVIAATQSIIGDKASKDLSKEYVEKAISQAKKKESS